MKWRSALPGLVVALSLTLAGCFSDEDASEDPEVVAQEAIRSFGQAASSQDGGEIKRITGSFSGKEDPSNSMAGISGDSFDMTLEWGRDGVTFMSFAIHTGGMSMTLSGWCSPTASFMEWGGDIFESRPEVDDEESCDIDLDGLDEEMDVFSSMESEGIEIEEVTVHDDGSMTVAFYDPENETHGTAEIDTKGRLVKITLDDEESTGSFEITYGKRDIIPMPTADQRVPAELQWSNDLEDGTYTGRITSSPEQPPLEELELRVVLRDWEEDTMEPLAAAALSPDPKTVNGYTFAFQDRDGDGQVSENDTFTIANPDWAGVFWMDEEITFYDKWAGDYVNENPVPAPGIALLAVGLMALAGWARRKA